MIYAEGTDYTLHADNTGVITSAVVVVNYTLVDETGDTLVDGDGNILVSAEDETQYGFSIFAPGTDYTVHTEA